MNVLILGAAVSGVAAARLAQRLGDDVIVYDQDPAALTALDMPGASGTWDPGLLSGIDLVVTSPGIPQWAPPIRDATAAGLPLISELEFAARHATARIVAVTGTNGKTTVTRAAADMLEASGVDAVAAGNIGTALCDVVTEPHEVIVVEASSFQLRFIDAFHPEAAVIVNIAPDHLDWHGDLAAYTAAKLRIAENQGADDILVYDADDPGAAAAVAGLRHVRLVPVSGRRIPDGGNGADGGALVVDGHRYPAGDVDPTYSVDLVAAATAASHVGATPEGIAALVARFEPGHHRRTVVAVRDGVTFVNDSKATNPHAAVAAAAAYPSVVLIAGGRNKGLDLSPIATVPSIRHVVGIGEAAAELAAVIPRDRFHRAGDLAEAVETATKLAVSGDTVLLAPGCASFDMFASYEERGRRFEEIVAAREEVGHG